MFSCKFNKSLQLNNEGQTPVLKCFLKKFINPNHKKNINTKHHPYKHTIRARKKYSSTSKRIGYHKRRAIVCV